MLPLTVDFDHRKLMLIAQGRNVVKLASGTRLIMMNKHQSPAVLSSKHLPTKSQSTIPPTAKIEKRGNVSLQIGLLESVAYSR